MIKTVPSHVLLSILNYLHPRQLTFMLQHCSAFGFLPLYQYFNQQYRIVEYPDSSWREGERELPFWGERGDGGLAEHSLRFACGKSFLKSLVPMVAFKKLQCPVRIRGVLSQFVQDFKSNMQQLVQVVKELGVDLQLQAEMSKIEIYEAFRIMFAIYNNMPELAIEYRPIFTYFRDYMHKMYAKLEASFAQNDLVTVYDFGRLNCTALVTEIQLSNGNPFYHIATGFLIVLRPDDPEELEVLRHSFLIEPRGLKELCDIREEGMAVLGSEERGTWAVFVYITPNTFEQKLRLRAEQRVWTSAVELRLLSSARRHDESYEVMGLGFNYCSIRGIISSL